MRPSAGPPPLACWRTPVASMLTYAHVTPRASFHHVQGVGPPSVFLSANTFAKRSPAACRSAPECSAAATDGSPETPPFADTSDTLRRTLRSHFFFAQTFLVGLGSDLQNQIANLELGLAEKILVVLARQEPSQRA